MKISYKTHIQPHYNVAMAFEDNLKVAHMWEEEKVPVILVGYDWQTLPVPI